MCLDTLHAWQVASLSHPNLLRPLRPPSHAAPHFASFGKRFQLDNLQTLCISCHSTKTGFEKRGPMKHDADGLPTDKAHPWNKEDD